MCSLKKTIILVSVLALSLTGCTDRAGNVIDVKPDGTLLADIVPVSDTGITENGYTLAAKSGEYSLYYEKTGLTVYVKNDRTGAVMTSAAVPNEDESDTWKNFVNSGIVLEYYKGTATNINKINMYSGKPVTKVTAVKNGFAAELDFKSIGISLTMLVSLNNGDLLIQVPNSSIKETNEQYHLAAIYVMPFLGYTRKGDTKGYMLLPDGCGALIDLKDNNGKFSQPYKAKVYGANYSVEENNNAVQKYEDSIATMADPVNISAPIFGMVHSDDKIGFLGIIESGKYNAEINAYPNGVITDYNWITTRYVYREIYLYPTGQTSGIKSIQKNRETFDISVRYRFAADNDADYTGLARAYRCYLLENGMLNKSYSIQSNMRLDFFAGDVEKSLFGTKFVCMTDVEDMDNILGELTQSGAMALTVSVKGWQKGGIYGSDIKSLKFEGAVGSAKKYAQITQKYGDKVKLLIYADLMNVYGKVKGLELIYRYNGKIFSDDTMKELHPVKYRLTSLSAVKLADALTDKVKDVKIDGVVFDGITNELYSYESRTKETMVSRQRYAKDISDMFEKQNGIITAFTVPNDYLWNRTENYYDYNVYASNYKFVTREVPFLAIVLHGSMSIYGEYVNFKADSTEYMLKMAESGVYPSFLITGNSPSDLIYTDSASVYSSEYSEYRETIIKYYKMFSAIQEAVGTAEITEHTVNGNVAVTGYSNGVKTVVNYTKTEIDYNGTAVGAQSCAIINGEAVS